MAKPTLIIHLGFFFPLSFTKIAQAFNAAGFPYWRILWNLRPLLAIIERYKKGLINTQEFKEQLCAFFPETPLTKAAFLACWNAGVIIRDDRLQSFFTAAHEKGFQIILTGNTNVAHIQHIQAELLILNSIKEGNAFPGLDLDTHAVLSYKQPQAEQTTSVLETAVQQLKQTGLSADQITVLIEDPDATPPTWMQWLNPLHRLSLSQARTQYQLIQRVAADIGCKTCHWQAASTGEQLFETLVLSHSYEAAAPQNGVFLSDLALQTQPPIADGAVAEVRAASEGPDTPKVSDEKPTHTM